MSQEFQLWETLNTDQNIHLWETMHPNQTQTPPSQSHPLPVSFAQVSDVKSQIVPQQIDTQRVILSKVSSPVLSVLVRGLMGLAVMDSKDHTVLIHSSNMIPGGLALYRLKHRANLFQNYIPCQYLENILQV